MVEEQTIRFSNKELSLLKNTFAEKPELYKLIRKSMLQQELNIVEAGLKDEIFVKNDELKLLFRKMFLPTFDDDVPLGQSIDLWMTVKVDDMEPTRAIYHLQARELLINYINQEIEALFGGEHREIVFNKLSYQGQKMDKCEEAFINHLARNTFATHLEQQLMQIKILAGKKDETPEETLKRIRQDSAK